MADLSISGSRAVREAKLTEGEHMGHFLRHAREARAMSLAQVASATKVPRSTLERLEHGDLGALPADVFVRGFIRSYARALGVLESEALALYDRARAAKSEAARADSSAAVVDPATIAVAMDDERETPRRGLGLAVFVIILLLIATITLSLLLRRPPQSGEGLSQAPRPAPAALVSPEAST